MMQLVHCPKQDQLPVSLAGYFPLSHAAGRTGACVPAAGQHVDFSSTVALVRHSLGQEVDANSIATGALLEALVKQQEPVRDAVLLVLMHCCRQFPMLSTRCIRHGLVGTLMRLVASPSVSDIVKVRQEWLYVFCPLWHECMHAYRLCQSCNQSGDSWAILLCSRCLSSVQRLQSRCYLTLSYLVSHIRTEGSLTEAIKGALHSDRVPQELVHALEQARSKTTLAASIVGALAGYAPSHD
jgi:hypothetical protein